ncbi:hypothetical protein FRC08_011551 [Ceratobasidium sp. 394]|nr:hypothetical protein FRC08_011551 [Ceratobasidium sp. 394]
MPSGKGYSYSGSGTNSGVCRTGFWSAVRLNSSTRATITARVIMVAQLRIKILTTTGWWLTVPSHISTFGYVIDATQTSNTDGSYYYSNPDGSTYHNSGSGSANYTSPSGGGWTESNGSRSNK